MGATESARHENASKKQLGLRKKYLLHRRCCTYFTLQNRLLRLKINVCCIRPIVQIRRMSKQLCVYCLSQFYITVQAVQQFSHLSTSSGCPFGRQDNRIPRHACGWHTKSRSVDVDTPPRPTIATWGWRGSIRLASSNSKVEFSFLHFYVSHFQRPSSNRPHEWHDYTQFARTLWVRGCENVAHTSTLEQAAWKIAHLKCASRYVPKWSPCIKI